VSLADLRSSRVQSVEGGYGATVGETGPEEPDVPIVPGARFYDLVPVRELPYRPRSSIAASEAEQMAASDYVPIFFKNRLHLVGRPQMSSRPSKRHCRRWAKGRLLSQNQIKL
jgi:hypothetical protein